MSNAVFSFNGTNVTDSLLNITNTSDSSNTTTLLATPYFIYWATWLGNTYGIIDAVGWLIDWIAAWWYYAKGDTPVVEGLKEHLKALQKGEDEAHKEQIHAAANICDMIIKHVKSQEDSIDTKPEKEELLHCINLIKEILIKEAQIKDHVGIAL